MTLPARAARTCRLPDILEKSLFPAALGKKQSPIDITPGNVRQDSVISKIPLKFSYDTARCTSLLNIGYGWRVDVHSDGVNLSGGPLEHRYKLVQFHAHWGRCSERGSEHTVDGRSHAGELHLVHWNCDLYAAPSKAISSEKGISVIGVFLAVGREHPELKKVTDLLHLVSHRDRRCSLKDLCIPSLLPDENFYWTYEGSLTTPPYHQTVTWIMFKKPIEVSEEQLMKFREMCCHREEECCGGPGSDSLLVNYRPTQPLEGRIVREPALHLIDSPPCSKQSSN